MTKIKENHTQVEVHINRPDAGVIGIARINPQIISHTLKAAASYQREHGLRPGQPVQGSHSLESNCLMALSSGDLGFRDPPPKPTKFLQLRRRGF